MKYKIGIKVVLNNKEYKIVGTYKRSWLLEDSAGKRFKATSNMMNKMIGDDYRVNDIRKKRNYNKRNYMKERLDYRKIFDKTIKMPETEDECLSWLDMISSDLSPENLHCDGEISRSAARKKYRVLKSEWKEVEKILGYKISEDEIEMKAIEKWRNK